MTIERIDTCFSKLAAEGKTALIAYLTIGYPSIEESFECALAALEAGADVLELGVPFSDPTADGPVIAAAMYDAIRGGGNLRAALEVARRLRERSDKPMVLFTYYNPVLAFGEEELVAAATAAGLDGILVVDLPPEEGRGFRDAAARAQLAIVPLAAPTTGADREPRILEGARGFVYYVSVTGVTGTGEAPLAEAGRQARALQDRSGLPVVVGFGIDGPTKAREVAAQGARGVVVGTALVRAIGAAAPGERARSVADLIAALRAGLDRRDGVA
ncbi:MAG: tryptophan synthase subunit alpha [Myxococcales bacterium]|jgi:tryptophan synthase alpha chain|nr:tryptophan synthase subunit alpha [Myxococcales bacterium]